MGLSLADSADPRATCYCAVGAIESSMSYTDRMCAEADDILEDHCTALIAHLPAEAAKGYGSPTFIVSRFNDGLAIDETEVIDVFRNAINNLP